jgi:hypothetical protein
MLARSCPLDRFATIREWERACVRRQLAVAHVNSCFCLRNKLIRCKIFTSPFYFKQDPPPTYESEAPTPTPIYARARPLPLSTRERGSCPYGHQQPEVSGRLSCAHVSYSFSRSPARFRLLSICDSPLRPGVASAAVCYVLLLRCRQRPLRAKCLVPAALVCQRNSEAPGLCRTFLSPACQGFPSPIR